MPVDTRRNVDRRQFLIEAAAGAAGVLGGPAVAARQARGATAQADVLIIGAGMAGAAAGSSLRAGGVQPIILEGRPDRIGGRIWSSYAWPDACVDLGASWLTHATINPLLDLANASGIQVVPSDLLNFTLSEADGRVLPEAEVERLFLLYSGVYAGVKVIAEQRIKHGLPDLPASDAFAAIFQQAQFSADTRRRLGFFLNYTIKEPNASPLSDLSLKNWDDDLVFVQLALGVMPKGYVQLVHRLAVGLDIRMGHVVQSVAYGPQGVTVATSQGQFSAPYAIVTLPHGVLQSGSVTFTPPLPAWKQAAIERIHTGVSNKTYLRFPHRFWNPEPDTLGRIAETPQSHWSTWINFYKYEGIPMLMAFNHSKYAVRLESMSDTEVIDEAMQVLRKQYGRGIPDPVGIQRSRWAGDPFSAGTVAHVPPGASSADYAVLGMPVGPLGFAGDSTTPDFPTLVFGAYQTGVREALRILALMGLGSPSASISSPSSSPVASFANPAATRPIPPGPAGITSPLQSTPVDLRLRAGVGQERVQEFIIRRKIRGGSGSGFVPSGGARREHDLAGMGPSGHDVGFGHRSGVELHRSGTPAAGPDARPARGPGGETASALRPGRSPASGGGKHPPHGGSHPGKK
jgi:monoamine oxidase